MRRPKRRPTRWVRSHQGFDVQIQQPVEADERPGEWVFSPAAQFLVQLLDSGRRIVGVINDADSRLQVEHEIREAEDVGEDDDWLGAPAVQRNEIVACPCTRMTGRTVSVPQTISGSITTVTVPLNGSGRVTPTGSSSRRRGRLLAPSQVSAGAKAAGSEAQPAHAS